MGGRRTPSTGATKGNFVAEWFGHRVWPKISATPDAIAHQSQRLCPFLCVATEAQTPCIKAARGYEEPVGVCTISSDSNGKRQDWLACPYRTLDSRFTLLETAVRTAYGIEGRDEILLFPVPILSRPDIQSRIADAIKARDRRAFVFSSNKLGGEIDIPETPTSPGGKVDMSVIEVEGIDAATGRPSQFGRHMFYEIQTADFHGSPLHAVRLLKAAFPRDAKGFSTDFACEASGTGVEGPNKANIFKRTIYQMIYKIQLAHASSAAGFVIVLPEPVWDSWKRHLGQPILRESSEDKALSYLLAPHESLPAVGETKSWVLVFDIDRDSSESPQPIKILERVAASANALLHYAFQEAAEKALGQGVIDQYRTAFAQRILTGWRGVLPPEDQPITPTAAP